MSEELFYRRQVSRQHLEVLAQYMERYPPLALASVRSREGHLQSKRMWEKIARTLNRIDDSVTKNGKSWARYWIDLKFKLRRKYAVMRQCQEDGSHCTIHLTPLEERIVKILTDEEGNLLPTASVYHQIKLNHPMHCQLSKYTVTENLRPEESTENGNKIDDSGGHYDTHDDNSQDEDYLTANNVAGRCRTELVNITENDVKPNINKDVQDPIQIGLPNGEERKTTEDLRRELLEFELRKQKELFEIEKEQRKEKHELEVAILRLRKQLLSKELKKL